MTQSVDSSKRSKNHKPEVNLDPNQSSSHLLYSLSLDSAPKKKKSKKNKKRRKHRKDESSYPSRAMILISPMTVIIDVNDAKIRNIGKSIRSDYAQL